MSKYWLLQYTLWFNICAWNLEQNLQRHKTFYRQVQNSDCFYRLSENLQMVGDSKVTHRLRIPGWLLAEHGKAWLLMEDIKYEHTYVCLFVFLSLFWNCIHYWCPFCMVHFISIFRFVYKCCRVVPNSVSLVLVWIVGQGGNHITLSRMEAGTTNTLTLILTINHNLTDPTLTRLTITITLSPRFVQCLWPERLAIVISLEDDEYSVDVQM